MSIGIGMVIGSRVLVAADRRTMDNNRWAAPYRKLRRVGAWVVATCGSTPDDHLFFHGLPEDFDFSNPIAYRDRLIFCQEHWLRINDVFKMNYASVFTMLAAKNGELYSGNEHGIISPLAWEVIGFPQSGTALMFNEYRNDLSSEAAEALARRIYETGQAITPWIGGGLDIAWTDGGP